MNLDEQLRAALDREAEMQKGPAPDVDRLISGGRVRRRRRNVVRFGVASALAVVLVGGGVYGVRQIDTGAPDPAHPRERPRRRFSPKTSTWSRAPTGWWSASMRPASRSSPTSPSTDRTGSAGPIRRSSRTTVFMRHGTRRRGRLLARGTGRRVRLHQRSDRDPGQHLPSPRRAARQAPTEHGPSGTDTGAGVRPRRPPSAAADRPTVPRKARTSAGLGVARGRHYVVAETPRGSHGITYGHNPCRHRLLGDGPERDPGRGRRPVPRGLVRRASGTGRRNTEVGHSRGQRCHSP